MSIRNSHSTRIDIPHTVAQLESDEQKILTQIKKVIGDKTVSERKHNFAPQWIIDKAKAKEKDKYDGCFEEVKIKDLPKDANLITSHHFFQVKSDGTKGKLKLKCRLLPHGNKNKYKDEVRKESASAQFPIIRLVLSIAAFLGFTLASIDIKGAYLQGGSLGPDIFIYPPARWGSAGRIVWMLIKPAYGIVESGRL